MTPLDRARRTLVDVHRMHPKIASHAVQAVLHELANPDAEMRTAGEEELRRELLVAGHSPAYVRDLAVAVWRAMLFRAD